MLVMATHRGNHLRQGSGGQAEVRRLPPTDLPRGHRQELISCPDEKRTLFIDVLGDASDGLRPDCEFDNPPEHVGTIRSPGGYDRLARSSRQLPRPLYEGGEARSEDQTAI